MSESRRVRFDIAYDGTDFSGWAKQPGRRTCQGELERALETVTRQPVRLTVAGRTDAGVHAAGQVAHGEIPTRLAADDRLARRISAIASRSGDLAVLAVRDAAPGFDARFSATFRRYEYRILTEANPIERRTAAVVHRHLDVDAMQQAADAMLGLQDFAGFCRPRERATTIRRLETFSWRREHGVLVASLVADAFCHSMVRSIVGACVGVGEGRFGLAAVEELMHADARQNSYRMMPAAGLTLVEVGYPTDDRLGAQAARAQRRRTRDDLAAAAVDAGD